VPPPAILIEPGVKAAAVDVQRDVVADFGPEDGTQRVMDLGWDPDTDDLRIITEWGVRWIDLADGSHRDVAFMQHMFRATPVLTSAGLRVVGLSGSRDVPVLRLDGSRDVVLRGERYELPIAGDVASAAGSEILLPYRDGVRVYSGAGEMLRFVRGLEYTSDYTFVQADRDGELEIVLMRPMRGAMEVRVVNFDGSVAYDWRRSEGTSLSWIPPLGSDLLWGVTSAGFVAFGPGGRQVHAYPAEGVSYLRDVAGARVGEFVALVASGNGYRGRSMLTIYDRYAALVYQEIFTGRVYTVASHPTEPVLFVGAHERVLRYRIRSEP
jgi:hypothetical protein